MIKPSMTNLEDDLLSEYGQSRKQAILLQLQSQLTLVNEKIQIGNTPNRYKNLVLQRNAIQSAINVVNQYTQ